MEPEDYEGQVALINEYLDDLDIPRKSKAGALYSTYGRVTLLGDDLIHAREFIKSIVLPQDVPPSENDI